MGSIAIPAGIAIIAFGALIATSSLWEYKAPQPQTKKQWLNKGVYGAERIAHWGNGEVWLWVSREGLTYYIFKDEDGSISATPAFYKWGERVDRDKPTPQPESK